MGRGSTAAMAEAGAAAGGGGGILGGLLAGVAEAVQALASKPATNKEWSAASETLMFPVERYLWLFPNDVRTMVHGAQQREGFFPSTHHFLQGVWIALFLCLVRFLLDRALFMPLGAAALKLRYWGKPSPLETGQAPTLHGKPPSMGIRQRLADDVQRRPLPSKEDLRYLSQATRVSEVALASHFRWCRLQARDARRLCKFKEACWRALLYLSAVFMAVACVLPQPWFHDIQECWRAYPLQTVPEAVVWYYMFQLGVYLHLSAYQFVDTRRSDFWEMFVHHLATVGLILFSWLSCFWRIGTLVMLIHDPSDVFLETAKIFNYTSAARPWAQSLTDALFVCFALSFFSTRLIVYPFWVVHSTLTHAHTIIGGRFALMHLFYGMLFVLQGLHVFWFYLIARMALKMLVAGKVEKDVRSDDEDGGEEEEEMEEEQEQGNGGRGEEGAVAAAAAVGKNGKDGNGQHAAAVFVNGNGNGKGNGKSVVKGGGDDATGDKHEKKTQ